MLAGEYEMDACAAGASAQMRVCAWPRGAAGLREIFLNVGALPLANTNTWRCTCEHCIRVFLVCDYRRIPGFLRTSVASCSECVRLRACDRMRMRAKGLHHLRPVMMRIRP